MPDEGLRVAVSEQAILAGYWSPLLSATWSMMRCTSTMRRWMCRANRAGTRSPGCRRERYQVKSDSATGCSAAVGLNSGYIEIFKLPVDGKSQQVGVIEHASARHRPASIQLRKLRGLILRANTGVRHAMVMRILMDDRRNRKSAEELADAVFGVAYADVFHESQHARPVG